MLANMNCINQILLSRGKTHKKYPLVSYKGFSCPSESPKTIKGQNHECIIESTALSSEARLGKASPPWEVPFDIEPTTGLLEPGGSMLVEVSFTPNAAKIFTSKIPLKIKVLSIIN